MELVKKTILPLLLVVLVACSWFNRLDSVATEKVDAGLKRALISFATARTLNAVISVIQGTDIAIEPAGVGVKLAPGQALDPINDLVEKFSNLMLMACVSFGIQHVLIKIGGHWALSIFLTSVTVLWCLLYLRRVTMPTWVTTLLVMTVVLRFAIPTVTLGTDVLFQNFLAKEYSSSQAFIETSVDGAKKLTPPVTLPENSSIWDKVKGLAPQNINISNKISSMVQAAEQWPEQIVRLMVVFLLDTLIIPLALLWLLVIFVKSCLEVQFTLLTRNSTSAVPRGEDLSPR